MADIEVKDNSKEYLAAFEKQLALGLRAVGEAAEGHAKKDCPVDTGRLRNSITYATNDYSGVGTYSDSNGNSYSDATATGTPPKSEVYIGTNVEYAQYVEFRDKVAHPTGKAHFLRDAAAKHGKEYRAIIKAALQE